MKRACLGALALFMAVPAGAAVYKWVDADGQVHFSDHPQTTDKTQSVTLHNSHGLGGLPPEPMVVKNAGGAVPDDKDKAAREAAAKELATKNCESMNKAIADSAGKPMVTITDLDGNKQVYQGHGTEQARDRMREDRDKWCAEAAKYAP